MTQLRAMILLLSLSSLISAHASAIILRDPTQPYEAQKGQAALGTQYQRPGLSAIIISGRQRLAVLDNKIVTIGESVNGNTVIDIQPNTVELRGAAGNVTLFLLNQSVKNETKE
ncbi:MAG: hypothetical protein SFW66_10565 [Gammaproteobacteria bacterium]|nr:hypothetical protein [Gammaproteobacteria bacterium]